MRKNLLLGSAAVLVVLSYGASAQTTNKEQTNRSTTAPAAQSTAPAAPAPSSGTSAQSGTTSGQTSPSDSTATSNPPRGTTSTATPPSSSPNAATSSQPPAARASGSTTAPNTMQNSGTAATNPAPANPAQSPSGTAQRNNTQTPSGQAPSAATQTAPQQTAPQTPSTQQQATQPNTNAGTQTQQATQPQATQPNGAAQQQNAQRNQAPGGVVSLDVQQRTQIGQTIARHNVKPVRNMNFSIAVGTAVPRSIQLRALPTDLVTFVPQYRGYSYFVVEEQIVIVEPSSTQIVAVIPYAGGSATRTAAPPAPTKSRAVKLSTQERDVIRRHTSRPTAAGRDSDAPARKANRRYSVGDEVETTEMIETFPETVYREAPSVRRYRYLRQDDNVILVDPDDHRVVDIFD